MSDESQTEPKTTSNESTTLVYKKYFAAVGVACGLILFFATPPLVLQFHVGFDGNYSRRWVESLPTWVASSMLLIGMGGGVLIILLSALFGVLIPSRVTRERIADADKKPVDYN
jgi:hypothetical protein